MSRIKTAVLFALLFVALLATLTLTSVSAVSVARTPCFCTAVPTVTPSFGTAVRATPTNTPFIGN